MNDIKPRPVKRNIDIRSRQQAVTSRFSPMPDISRPPQSVATVAVQAKHLSRRATYIIFCIILMFQTVSLALLPVLTNTDKLYALSDQAKEVVGESNEELIKKLTFDAESNMYQYNKDAAPAGAPDSPEAAMAAAQNSQKVGGGADNYTVDLSADPEKGVTIRDATDKTGNLAIQMIPQFAARDGKQQDGRVVYPLKGIDGHLVYTVKANGLKEDIVLDKFQGDELSFSYKLVLPETLEARLLDNGGIGIYSADSTLFGNISFGSDADREKVEKARTLSDKTNLVFAIPAPVIIESGKKESGVSSKFELKGNILTVHSAGLEKANYPLSIDPSVVVTSANDFQNGNIEGGIEINSSGYIQRSGLTGGNVGTWTDITQSMGQRKFHATVVYQDRMYVIAGCDTYNPLSVNGCTNVRSDIGYTTLNNGTITAFTNNVGNLPTARTGHAATIYNGYMYVIGGFDSSGTTGTSTVYYSKINQDGTLGTWNTTAALLSQRGGLAAAVHNGYMYALGGNNGASNINHVQFAAINSDGTLGSWQYTHDSINDGATFVAGFTNARWGHRVEVYNGYIYLLGGCVGTGAVTCNTAYYNDVQYAPLNADGTVGTWASTTSFTTTRVGLASTVGNGYIYIMGGVNGGGYHSDFQYAPINADGTVGTWIRGANYAGTARSFFTVVGHNGYMYHNGGTLSSQSGNPSNNTVAGEVQAAGALSASTVDADVFESASYFTATVAYNGYLYVIGGCSDVSCNTLQNKVRYTAINADGSIGIFTTSGNNLVGARAGHAAFAYNNRLYVVGGCTATLAGACTGVSNSTQYSGLISTGNPAAWTNDTTDTFTTSRWQHGALVHNNRVYIAGGCAASCSPLNDVQYANINAAGDIGAFTNFGNFDGVGRVRIGFVSSGSHLYVVGGGSTTVSTGDIRYAAVANDGSLSGSWNDAGNDLITARYWHGTFFYKGNIYVAGGCTGGNCTTILGSTEYAPINADGTIGSFNLGASLQTSRYIVSAVAYGDFIYTSGGCTGVSSCDSLLANVEYAPINNGGSGNVGSWSATTPTSFGNARYGVGTVAHNGFLYATGGFDSVTAFDTTLYAPINSDGTVGAWATTSTIPAPRYFHTTNIHNGYMYVVGGRASGAGLSNTVYYALICTGQNSGVGGCSATPGTVGTWTTTTVLPSTRALHGSTVANGYMYVAGGCTTTGIVGECTTIPNSVIYALICTSQNSGVGGCGATPGTVGTWTTSPNTFGTGRNYPGLTSSNGYLYIVGGCNINCGTSLSDVQVAKVNTDGSIDPWRGITRLPEARHNPLVSVYNGFLYVASGATGGALLNSSRFAAINSDGTIGDWNAGSNLNVGRVGFGSAVYNGRLYVVAGGTNASFTSGTFRQDVEVAGLKSIARKGTYSRMFDLGGDAVATKLLYRGTQTAESINFRYRNANNTTGVFGSTIPHFLNRSNQLLNLAATEQRYRQLIFTLDDSQNSVFPDSLGTTSTLEDFELYFHAATDSTGSKRLRGGKTFTTEQQRSLDAQPFQ